MSEVVERVTRAIYEKNHADKWPGALSRLEREVFVRCAEAAIAAMGDGPPTEAMVEAGAEALLGAADFPRPERQFAREAALTTWRAMNGAALGD